MRYLSIDYGKKRVGIAVSGETGNFAFPLKVLENTENLMNDIESICDNLKIEKIVVGESLNFNQKENEIMKEIIPFAENLKKSLRLPVEMHPEFLTSQEAERLQGKNDMNDASAAAIILKSYLDFKNNKK